MSAPMDLNLMDFLLNKSDTNLDDTYFTLKQERDVSSSALMDDGIAWAGADDFLDGIFSLDGVDPDLDILNLPTVDASADLSIPPVEPLPSNQFIDFKEKAEPADHASATSDSATSDSGLCSDVDIVDCQTGSDSMLLDDEEEISPAYSPAVSSPGPSVSEVGLVFSPEHSLVTSGSSGSSGDSDDMCSSVNDAPPPEKRNKIKNVQYSSPRIINVQNQKPAQQYTNRKNSNAPKTTSTNHNAYSTSPASNNQSNIRKVIRLSAVNSGNQSNNQRSIFLPVTIKDMKDLRTIKIINASGLKKTSAGIKLAAANLLQQGKQGLLKSNVVLTQQQLGIDDSVSEKGSHSDDSILYDEYNEDGETAYPRLVLTAEEQRLLVKEGITLPSNYPLTKHEERELKRIRRKIRNKISAQDSRKRKKEYVDGLEDRVKQCTEENQSLMKRIKVLQNQNQSLATQLRKLHSMLAKGTNKSTQPATCLMVLLLSMALIAVPSVRHGGTSVGSQQELAAQQHHAEQQADQNAMASSRRSLLYTKNEGYMEEPIDDEINMDDLLTFHSDHDYPIMMKRSAKRDTGTAVSPRPRKRALMDLPVDDTWPPPKMKKYDRYVEDRQDEDENVLYDTPDVKSEIEYDYYYTDDEAVNIYEPLDGIEELGVSNGVYSIGGKIGELLDVAGQVSVNSMIVNDLEQIAGNAKNKSEANGKASSKVVVQVTEQ